MLDELVSGIQGTVLTAVLTDSFLIILFSVNVVL